LIALIGIPVAAVLGFALAHAGGGHASSAPLDRQASAGSVQVSYPSDWGRETPRATLPLGLTDELALGPSAPAGAQLVLGRDQTADLPLLSKAVLASFPSAPTAQIVTLGGNRFYRYLNPARLGGDLSESVYALPTTTGAVIGACIAPHADSAFTSSCERLLATIKLPSGSVLAVGPSVSYAAALDSVISKLNAVRVGAGSKLRSARDAQAQAAAANQLAAAHGEAASAIARLNAGSVSAANRAVATALRMVGDGYAALGHAAAANNARGYAAASASLTGATTALNSAFDRLGQLGYRVTT
jgi:hypothetical protein